MKCNFPIEVNGIKRIVIDDVLFVRSTDNTTWLNTKNNKHIIDAHMWARVKRMGNKAREIEETIIAPISGCKHIVWNEVPCYRVWSNLDTINIEKLYY